MKRILNKEKIYYEPLGNKLWVKQVSVTDSGVAVPKFDPDQADVYAEVISKGPECEDVDLEDIVLFRKGAAWEVNSDEGYFIVREGDVISIVKEAEG